MGDRGFTAKARDSYSIAKAEDSPEGPDAGIAEVKDYGVKKACKSLGFSVASKWKIGGVPVELSGHIKKRL